MDEEIYIIIGKVLQGEASAAEQETLRAWRLADSRNEVSFREMSAMWQEADRLLETPVFDTEAAWKRVAAATVALPQAAPAGRRLSLGRMLPRIGMAAAALLAVLFIYRQYESPALKEVVARDHHEEIVLPDNSHIILRKGSTLKYPASFAARERRVQLEGEAFFEVTPGKDRPFVVDADAAEVRVLGTSFNVACTKDLATVTVATGRVQMTGQRGDKHKHLILSPGEQGRLKKGGLSKDFVSSDSYLYWKTGVLHFRQEPLSNVIRELGHMSRVSISFDPSMSAAARSQIVNISFKEQAIEDMLTDLCLITHCEWSDGKDGYTIRAIN